MSSAQRAGQRSAPQARLSRRSLLLCGAAAAAVFPLAATARSVTGKTPWEAGVSNLPEPVTPGALRFFTAPEARMVDAMVERLIPEDDLSPSGKDAGCTIFIDAQLAGPYGGNEKLYMQGPFKEGTDTQGDQLPWTHAERWRMGLASLDEACRKQHGKGFADLDGATRDAVLSGLEDASFKISPIPPKVFFQEALNLTMEGFFADPLYGGNRDMVGWKMVGFPGARYDYRPWLTQYGQKLDLEPVSMLGRTAWTPANG